MVEFGLKEHIMVDFVLEDRIYGRLWAEGPYLSCTQMPRESWGLVESFLRMGKKKALLPTACCHTQLGRPPFRLWLSNLALE